MTAKNSGAGRHDRGFFRFFKSAVGIEAGFSDDKRVDVWSCEMIYCVCVASGDK